MNCLGLISIVVTKKEGAYSSITVDSIAKSPRPCYGGALTKRFIMGKSTPSQAKIVERFLDDPREAEIHEVMPLIPGERILSAIEDRYGVTPHTTRHLSLGRLAAVIETCEALREGGLDPSEYNYDAWFQIRQESLDGLSPRLLLMRGDVEGLAAYAERTVAQVKKLG